MKNLIKQHLAKIAEFITYLDNKIKKDEKFLENLDAEIIDFGLYIKATFKINGKEYRLKYSKNYNQLSSAIIHDNDNACEIADKEFRKRYKKNGKKEIDFYKLPDEDRKELERLIKVFNNNIIKKFEEGKYIRYMDDLVYRF